MKSIHIIGTFFAVLLVGCQSEPSLQKYYVESIEKKGFSVVDISPSILNLDKNKLTAEQNTALESFDKMNILAFKVNDSNKAEYETEKAKIKEILKDEKYQELVKFNQGKNGASVSFVGNENNIDEFVLFANQGESGFAVVRVLGDDMNPTGIMNMLSLLKDSKLNMEQLKPLQDLMPKN
jgi:hypothetical protein